MLTAFAVITVAACDLPSDAPSWDTRWVVRADSTRISVVELLPDGVTVNPAGDAFDIDVEPTTLGWTLAEVCPPCSAFDQLIVPTPAFQGSVAVHAEFPPELLSVRSRTGSVVARVTNGFSFDPLRPSAGAFGTLTVTLLDGSGNTLDSEVLPGTDTAFPPGGSVSFGLEVGAVTVADRFTVRIEVDSPPGDPVMIDASDEITVRVEPDVVLVESAEVILPVGPVALDGGEMGLEDIDGEVIDRIESGSLLLDIDNPFGVEIALALRIEGPTFSPITKPVTVVTGQSDIRVQLTGAELRSFLGQPSVTFSGDGTVTAASAAQTVTPTLGIDVLAGLDLTLRIGG